MDTHARRAASAAFLLFATLVPLSLASVLPEPVPECSNLSDDDDDGGTDAADDECDNPRDDREGRCRGHGNPHSHTYGSGGSLGAGSDTVTGGDEVGHHTVIVSGGCKRDTGVGGGFFGYGPWADESICNYGLTLHGGTVNVNDFVFGSDIAFVVGADDTSGPAISVDPITGETTCATDGSVTPGDPATDPTADADDCLSNVYVGSGSTCGAGGDGGYWVFLYEAFLTEGAGGVGSSNIPTAGTLTA